MEFCVKSFFCINVLFALLVMHNAHSMSQGQMSQQLVIEGIMTWSTIDWALQGQQSYTAGQGGITFTYPTDTFTVAPAALITVNTVVSHGTTETYTAEVTSNSSTSATVTAYLNDNGTVSEAPTGSVSITLMAFGN